MDKDILINTVARLTNSPKGILAADESSPTCNKRFEALGIPTTEENRRQYRELLITTPDISEYISGFILYDETIRQATKDGKSFTSIMNERGIDIGIKVDAGLKDFSANEKVSQGLEGLTKRLQEYRKMGATFAKWRSVINIGEGLPTDECLKANAEVLANYALACQAENIVPIIEPEVLLDGSHTIERCYEVTAHNLDIVFTEFSSKNVFLEGIILKTSMVLSGKDAGNRASPDRVAQMTIKCLKEYVPKDIKGIVFLSGGQSEEESTVHLNLMHQMGALPWNLTFSYSRAIQNPVLKYWAQNRDDISGAQKILLTQARANSLASIGQYDGEK